MNRTREHENGFRSIAGRVGSGLLWLVSLAALANAQSESGVPILPGQPASTPPALARAGDPYAFQNWWFLNQEALLDLRRELRLAVGGDRGFRRVLDSELEAAIAALERGLGDSNPEVRAAAALALGKCGEREALALLFAEHATARQAPIVDPAFEVKRATLLALGIGGDAAALRHLESVMRSGNVAIELRAVAAIAIGLLGFTPATGESAAPAALAPLPAAPVVTESSRLASSGEPLLALAVQPGGKRLAIGRAGGRVDTWSWPAATVGREIGSPGGEVVGLGFTADGSRLAIAVAGGAVHYVDVRSDRTGARFDGLPKLRCGVIGADDRFLAGSETGEVLALPASGDAKYVVKIAVAARPITRVLQVGPIVVAGDEKGGLHAVDPKSGTSRRFDALNGAITSLAASRDRRTLYAATAAGEVAAFVMESFASQFRVEMGSVFASLALLEPEDGKGLLAASSADGQVRFLDPADGEVLLRHRGGGSQLLVLDATAKSLAAAEPDGAIAVLGVASPGTDAEGGRLDLPSPGALPRDAVATSARAALFDEMLDVRVYETLEAPLQHGLAIAAGLSGETALAPRLLALLERGRGRAGSPSIPSLGFVATSLGMLAARGAAGSEILLSRALEDELAQVRRGAAIGVGIAYAGLGRMPQGGEVAAAIVKRLERRVGDEPDLTVENALIVALGRIGGGVAGKHLVAELRRERGGGSGRSFVAGPPRVGFDEIGGLPFQAAALGLMREVGGYPKVLHEFETEGSIHLRGPLALALGLYGPTQAKANDRMLKRFQREKSPSLAAHLALGLGMARALDAKDAIVKRLLARDVPAEILPQLAIGAALLEGGDRREVAFRLIERLAAEKSGPHRAAIGFALGQIGDHRAVAPLIELAGESAALPEVRAAALTALGELLDPLPLSKLAQLRQALDAQNEPRLLDALGVTRVL
jgi:HEAT repeat protein